MLVLIGRMHPKAGPRSETHSVQNVETDDDSTGQFHRKLQNCDDWEHLSGNLQLRVHSQHSQVCRPGQGT